MPQLRENQRGATLTEAAMLLCLVALICIPSVRPVTKSIRIALCGYLVEEPEGVLDHYREHDNEEHCYVYPLPEGEFFF